MLHSVSPHPVGAAICRPQCWIRTASVGRDDLGTPLTEFSPHLVGATLAVARLFSDDYMLRTAARAVPTHSILPSRGGLRADFALSERRCRSLQTKPPSASQRLLCNSLRHLHAFTPFSEKGVKSQKYGIRCWGVASKTQFASGKILQTSFPWGLLPMVSLVGSKK